MTVKSKGGKKRKDEIRKESEDQNEKVGDRKQKDK